MAPEVGKTPRRRARWTPAGALVALIVVLGGLALAMRLHAPQPATEADTGAPAASGGPAAETPATPDLGDTATRGAKPARAASGAAETSNPSEATAQAGGDPAGQPIERSFEVAQGRAARVAGRRSAQTAESGPRQLAAAEPGKASAPTLAPRPTPPGPAERNHRFAPSAPGLATEPPPTPVALGPPTRPASRPASAGPTEGRATVPANAGTAVAGSTSPPRARIGTDAATAGEGARIGETTSDAPPGDGASAVGACGDACRVVAARPRPEARPDESPSAAVGTARQARVVVHYTAGDGAARARELVARLEAAGLGEGNVRAVDFEIGRDNARFFWPEDRALARRALQAMELSDAALRDFTHYAASPRRGTVELWLSG